MGRSCARGLAVPRHEPKLLRPYTGGHLDARSLPPAGGRGDLRSGRPHGYPPPMPLLIVHLVVMPLVAEMYAQGRRTELERTLRSMATLGSIPASLVLATFVLLGGPILGLVYGDYYRTGATVLALLSLGQLVNVWTGCCTTTLMMTGHQLAMMTITMVCGSLTIVAILLVVGPYGSTGVAVATAAGLGLQNILMWLGARAATGMWTHAGLAGLFGSKGTAGTG